MKIGEKNKICVIDEHVPIGLSNIEKKDISNIREIGCLLLQKKIQQNLCAN